MDLKQLQDLLDRFQDHSEDAADALVKEYSSLIRKIARRGRHPQLKSRLDIADIVQDVWIKILVKSKNHGSFPLAAAFPAFLEHVAMHTVADLRRKHLDAEKRDHRRECEVTDQVRQKGNSAEQDFNCLEEFEHDLELLSIRDRCVVVLRFHGSSNLDIAFAMGITERSVRNILRRLDGRHVLASQHRWAS